MSAPPENVNQAQPNQPNEPVKKTKPKKEFSPVVSVVGIILTSLFLFTGGYLYLQYLQTQNIEETEKSQEEEKQQEEERAKQIGENAKNDQIRKLDLANLEKGLDEYIEQNKKYPEKLEDLTSDYLMVIPLDPVTKNPYNYIPDENFVNYTLSAGLSDRSEYAVGSQE